MDARAHSRAVLAELLVSAAAELTAPPEPTVPAPAGRPVSRGRVALGRYRHRLTPDGRPCTVAAGFGTAAWIGPPAIPVPPLGALVHTDTGCFDARGRLVLPEAVRAYLAVADPDAFDAVLIASPHGGVFLVPGENFAHRQQEVARALTS